jgi:RHS repeat-associated protein
VQKQDSSGTTKHIWDGQNILVETDGNNVIQVVYTQGPEVYGNFITQARGGVDSFYLFDAPGSTRQLASSSASITDLYVYDSFGSALLASGATVNPFRYVGCVGYYYDVDLATHYIRARHYSPVLGRFLSRDPIGVTAQSNRYGYCSNNPTKNVDPSGLDVHVFALEGFGTRGGFSDPFLKNFYQANFTALGAVWHEHFQQEVGRARLADDVARELSEIATKKLDETCPPEYHRIVLIGYSFGGGMLKYLLDDLKQMNIKVDVVISVDPVPRRRLTAVPILRDYPNVAGLCFDRWVNFFQMCDTKTLLPGGIQGHSVPGAQKNTQKARQDFLNAGLDPSRGHTEIFRLKDIKAQFDAEIRKLMADPTRRSYKCGNQ